MHEVVTVQPVLEGEVILPGDTFNVLVQDIFGKFSYKSVARVGDSVWDVLCRELTEDRARKRAIVYLDGNLLYEDYWHAIRPKAGCSLAVNLVPAGGKNKGSGGVIGIVMALAMVAASIALPALMPGIAFWGISWGALAAGALSIVGTVAMSFLAGKPKTGKLSDLSSTTSQDSPTLFITGTQNEARLYGVEPILLGVHKVTPAYAAKPFTQLKGSDQFVIVPLIISIGPCKIENEKLGETLLSNFQDVESELFRGYLPSQITDKGNWDMSSGTFPAAGSFGDRYTITKVSGMPGGPNTTTDYYVIKVSTTVIKLSDTKAHALAGTNIIDITATNTGGFTLDYQPANRTFDAADVTIATERVTVTAHPYVNGQGPVHLVTGTGALPTPLAESTDYYINVVDANTIRFSTTQNNALAGTVINLTGAGSGTGNTIQTYKVRTVDTDGADPDTDQLTVNATHSLITGEGPFRLTAAYGVVDSARFAVGDTITYNELYGIATSAAWDKNQDKPSKLYPARINQDDFQILLSQDKAEADLEDEDGWQLRTTPDETINIGVDIGFLQGLVVINDEGGKVNKTVVVEIQYSPKGANTWSATKTLSTTAKQTSAVRNHLDWDVAEGQYDVRVRRRTKDATGSSVLDDVWWTTLQCVRTGNPFNRTDTCRKILKIRATDQLNGQVDNYTCTASRIVWAYNADTDSYKWAISSNNADLYREVFTGPGLANATLPLARLDTESLEDFWGWCRDMNFSFNMVIDFETNVGDVLDDICSAARASKSLTQSSKWGVVIDRPQGAPVHKYTERNIWDFQWRRATIKIPDAVLVRFINADMDYAQDQVEVRSPTYNAEAPVYLDMEFPGATNYAQNYALARFWIKQAILRPLEFTHSCDLEYAIGPRGSLVTLQHTAVLQGMGAGRVTGLITDVDDNITHVIMDESFYMELGKSYGISINTQNNPSLNLKIVTNTAEPHMLELSPMLAFDADALPQIEDIISFGELGTMDRDVLVKAILPSSELNATVTTMDYAPDLYSVDDEEIPPFQSSITLPTGLLYPGITFVRADESVLVILPDLSWYPVIDLTLTTGNTRSTATAMEFRYRPSGSIGAYQYRQTTRDAGTILLDHVEQDTTYDIQGRYLTAAQPGPWSPILQVFVEGARNLPDDVLEVTEENGFARWVNYVAPRDIRGYIVKYLPGDQVNWEGGILAHTGVYITEKEFNLASLPSGTVTLMVKALDLAYNESLNAFALVLDLGDPIVANVIETINLTALGYPGTITNGTVVSSEIRASVSVSDPYLPDDNALYLEDDSADYLADVYDEMTYEYTVQVDHAWPVLSIIYNPVVVGAYFVEYKPQTDGPYLPVDGDPYLGADSDPYLPLTDESTYQPWPGSTLVNQVYDAYTVRIRTLAGNVQGRITNAVIILDGEDQSEKLLNQVLTPGYVLPITKSYYAITAINFTLLGVTEATTISVAQPIDPTGPVVFPYDSGGTTTVNAHVEIQGIMGA